MFQPAILSHESIVCARKCDMPYEVQFTDRSEGGSGHNVTGWGWNFGDGFASSERNPLHSYNNIGEYNVSLTVTNDCGRNDISAQCIKVLGGDNMGEYTEAIVVTDSGEIAINVPISEANVPVKFLDGGLGTPLVGKNADLLTADGATVLQTKTTDVAGIATFTDVAHGNYKAKITY